MQWHGRNHLFPWAEELTSIKLNILHHFYAVGSTQPSNKFNKKWTIRSVVYYHFKNKKDVLRSIKPQTPLFLQHSYLKELN